MNDKKKSKQQLIDELKTLRLRLAKSEENGFNNRKIEEELEIKESAIHSSIVAIAIGDLEGNLTYANPSFLKMWGVEDENEIIGKSIVQAFYHFMPKEVKMADVLKTIFKEGYWTGERLVKRKHELPFNVHLSASIVKDKTGKPIRALATLIDATERYRMMTELQKREEELQIKADTLEELNTALNVLLKKREEDKNELESKILANVRELISPYIDILKASKLNSKHTAIVDVLNANLKNIISPFSSKLSSKYLNLTPMEIRVADLVKKGKTNQEIADLFYLSLNTIVTHRFHIRTKLGLKNLKVNLRTYLLSLD